MTNPVASDKFSTHMGVKEAMPGVRTPAQQVAETPKDRIDASARKRTDIGLASERLAQQMIDPPTTTVQSAEQARQHAARLQLDIAARPSDALQAFRNTSPNVVQAAVATPDD